MSYTILLVEDNPHIMEINREALMMEDYTVLEADSGSACMEQLSQNDVDLIVLDIMLPDGDGLSLCRRIKEQYDIPILFLSALGENEQIIDGLRAGGDDYLPKPYDIGVLLARIEARLRSSKRSIRFVSYGSLRLDTVSMIASSDKNNLLLTQKEFLLLLSLIKNADRLLSKEDIYREIWSTEPGNNLNAVYTTVSRLNKKLDDADTGLRVILHRGEGYALEDI
ncbi:MAG: response regulator transcription factor [Acutalibacteraceae bacterium]|nr:response regulator transcription factor [Acutalibacteraceae bacterium]HCA55451.1 DNA-binding response regulator [Oscillospiraceae bacterium]